MPPIRNDFPKYQRHSSGQARVRLTDPDGRRQDVLLGEYGSKESRRRYDEEISRWVANGRKLPADPTAVPDEITNNSLVLAFLKANLPKYDTGSSEGQVDNLKTAARFVRRLYGTEPARLMSPKRLKAIRSAMVGDDLSCRFVNALVSKIRSMYKWAVSEEMIPGEVIHSLSSVKALQPGEEGVRDKQKVADVPEEVVEKTIPLLPVMVRDVVRLLMLCGARCGELCILRPCDLDRTDPNAWVYKPTRHKGKRKGKERFVYFGPEAQEVLVPWLEGVEPEGWVFSPKRSEELRNAERGEKRVTKRWPSHLKRNAAKRKKVRKRNYSAHLKTHAVGVAIRRACEKLDERARREKNPDDKRKPKDVPKAERLFTFWHVHQIRHTSGTRVRKEFGAEVAQIFLGHSQLSTTEIYAQPDREAVKKAVAKLG